MMLGSLVQWFISSTVFGGSCSLCFGTANLFSFPSQEGNPPRLFTLFFFYLITNSTATAHCHYCLLTSQALHRVRQRCFHRLVADGTQRYG